MPRQVPRNSATPNARALLEKGLAFHRLGRLDEALATYTAVLQQEPRNSEALRFRGVAYCSQGKLLAAIGAFRAAVQAQPKSAEALFGLGDALQFNHELDEAVASYRQALQLRPGYAEALCNLGNALVSLKRYDEAIESFRLVLVAKPADARVLNNLSIVYRTLGRAAEALESSRAAIAADPSSADTWQNLALACELAKDTSGAVAAYRRLVRINPRSAEMAYRLGRALQEDQQHAAAVVAFRQAAAIPPLLADALLELGVSLAELEQWDAAREAYTRYQSLRPDSAVAWNNIGITFKKERRFPEAIEAFRKADVIKPGDRLILRNLGIALWSDKRWGEAIASAQQLLGLFPGDSEGFHNLATALMASRRFREAEHVIDQMLALNPRNAEAHVSRGILRQTIGQAAAALESFRAARELKLDLPEARVNEGLAQLLTGDLVAGWANYEARFHNRSAFELNRFDRPRWEPGEPLAGRTILIHAEQGLGDTMQFARYIPLLAAQGAVVYLEVQPTLKALLAGVPGAKAVFARGEPLPEFGCHCPLLSIPYCLGAQGGVIPPAERVLNVGSDRTAKWASKLGLRQRPSVGVVWSGNPNHENDHNRSVPLGEFAILFDLPGVQFFNLQKAVSPADARVLAERSNVIDLSSELDDFSDTAAAVEQLDLVIAVDTSVAHLAGSLGKPIWVLLPFAPDWRWLLDRADSPWYPTATLFRQPETADWKSPLARVSARLREFASQLA